MGPPPRGVSWRRGRTARTLDGMSTCRRRTASPVTWLVAGCLVASAGALATLVVPVAVVVAAGVLLPGVVGAGSLVARRLSLRRCGWGDGWGGDLGGVREPRRPRTPQGTAALDL